LCFHNILIITNFNVLKYIKKIFKVQHDVVLLMFDREPYSKINQESKITKYLGRFILL